MNSQRTTMASAFTLAELLIVIAISSMLMLSVSAAVTGTLDTSVAVSDELTAWQGVSSVLMQMERDIALAIDVTVSEEHRLVVTVPDSDGDGTADTIEYSWSGQSSTPLLRTFNDAAAAEVLPSASNIQFAYKYQQKIEPGIVSATHNLPLVTARFDEFEEHYETVGKEIDSSEWQAELFAPDTDFHRVDEVNLQIRAGTFFFFSKSVEVLLQDAKTGEIVNSGRIPSFFLWNRHDYVPYDILMRMDDSDYGMLTADREYRWIVKPEGVGFSGYLATQEVKRGDGPENRKRYEYSTDGGASYRNNGDRCEVPFVTRGTYVIDYGIHSERSSWRLRRIRIHLACGTGKNRVQLNTSVRLQNL